MPARSQWWLLSSRVTRKSLQFLCLHGHHRHHLAISTIVNCTVNILDEPALHMHICILLIAVTRFQRRNFLFYFWTFFYFFLLLFNEYMQVQCRFIKYIDRPCDYCQNGQMVVIVAVEKKKLEWFASDTAWQQSSLYWSVRAWEEKLV